MFLGHGILQGNCSLIEALSAHQLSHWNAIRVESLKPAQMPPLRTHSRVSHEPPKQFFVVAFERNVSGWKWIARQSLEHATRIGTPIDIIPKRNGRRGFSRIVGEITINCLRNLIEQIGTTVNIANNI